MSSVYESIMSCLRKNAGENAVQNICRVEMRKTRRKTIRRKKLAQLSSSVQVMAPASVRAVMAKGELASPTDLKEKSSILPEMEPRLVGRRWTRGSWSVST